MTYKLFYADGSAAMGVRVILEEIGAPYELIPAETDLEKPRSAEHLKYNPNGWVPVLAWGDAAMYESVAITVYLCDLYPQLRLAPPVDHPDRALFLQTLVYFSNTVQTAFQQYHYPSRFVTCGDHYPDARARGIARLYDTWRIVDDQIGAKTWTLGDTFSAVDIHLFMLTTWLEPDLGHPSLASFPNVMRLAHQAAQRQSIKRVFDL